MLSSAFLSLVLGAAAFYYNLRGSHASLVVDITAESNVLDVHRAIPDLAVVFQGADIQQQNANLKIATVRITNDGNVNILEGYYDSRIPWGLSIEGGRVVEARVTGANSPYLADGLRPRLVNENLVEFEKVIFDRGKYVTLELLILHQRTTEPRIKPVGKIAGIDDIKVTNSFVVQDHPSLAAASFRGPITVQIVRTFVYFLIALGVIIAVGSAVAGVVGVFSFFKKRARRRILRYLPRLESAEQNRKREALLQIFIEDGVRGLKSTGRMLKDDPEVRKVLATSRLHDASLVSLSPPEVRHVDADLETTIHLSMSPTLRPLLTTGLVRVVGGSLKVDPDIPTMLQTLVRQLSDADEEAFLGVEPEAGRGTEQDGSHPPKIEGETGKPAGH